MTVLFRIKSRFCATNPWKYSYPRKALLNDKKLNLSKVKILILDECDKMVEIGNKLNHEDVKFFIAQGITNVLLYGFHFEVLLLIFF